MSSRDQNLYTKLFVTNIPGDISKEYFVQLIQPYAKNGRIIETKFFKRVVSESCYAFIHFESAVDGEKCMEDLNRRVLNGHTMRVGPASKRNPSLSTTNLYIEGVPKEWTDADLRKHFGEFGEIAAARILVDKGSNASREVGFVHFTNHENALSAMETWQDNKAYKTAERPFKIKFANRARKKDEEEYEMMSSRSKNHRKMGHSNHRGSLSSMPPSSMPHAHNGSVSMMATMDASSATSYNHPVGPSQYPQTEMNTPRFDEPCRYFQRGHCKRGKNCFYRHGNVAVTPKSSSSSSHRHSSHHSYSHHQHHPHQQPHHAPQHHPHPAHHGHGHHGQHVHPSLIATHPSHAHPHYAIPPPPPPATYDPYTAAAVATATAAASMYPHTAAVPTDMSAYYQHYYNAYGATYPPQPSAATTAVAATPGDMAAYYQQAYAAQYPAAQYAAAPSYAGQYAAAASMPTQQPQQQQQPAVVTQQQQQQQQGMNNTGGGATDDKTNSTTTTETGSTVTNHAVAATAAVAATPVAAVQAPEMPTVGMQGAESSGYGASRQSSTAATDARWEPYKSQTNPNYYGHPTQQ